MALFIIIIIFLILCCKTTTNTEAFFKFSLIAFIVGLYVFHLIILENNKKEIDLARQNTLNNMHTLLKKHE